MSLKRAIDARCKACIYDPEDRGTWRAQVEACEATACPLFEWRPRTWKTPFPKEHVRSRRRALDAYCKWCSYHPTNGGTWRQQIAACPSTTCSLWVHRPRISQRTSNDTEIPLKQVI